LQAVQAHAGIDVACAEVGALQGHHCLEDGRVRGAARHARGLDDLGEGHVGVLDGALDHALHTSEEAQEGRRACVTARLSAQALRRRSASMVLWSARP